MAKAPAFSFYPADFLVGTAALILAERGAYITLLCHQWETGSVPGVPLLRARLLNIPLKQHDAIWETLRCKFTQGADGNWRNERLELERLRQETRRAALAENGKLGGRPKKAKANQKVSVEKPKDNLQVPRVDNQKKSLPSSSSSSSTPVLKAQEGVAGKEVNSFLKRFCDLYTQHRHGAKYLVKGARDVPMVRQLLATYGHERLEKLAEILLLTDHEWVEQTDRGIGILSVKASWLDSLLSEYTARRGAKAS